MGRSRSRSKSPRRKHKSKKHKSRRDSRDRRRRSYSYSSDDSFDNRSNKKSRVEVERLAEIERIRKKQNEEKVRVDEFEKGCV